jgi:hypothetical protein
LNHSWPDLTNPILARNGLDVAVGAGNLDLFVAEIRRRVSEELHVPIPEVNVWFIGQHVLVMRDVDLGMPYFCKIVVDDRDVTEQLDVDGLINGTFYRKVPTDVQTSWLMKNVVATCALRIIRAMINDTGEVTHAPGPNGLIGGYPVRVDATGQVVLPGGISLEQAERINIEGSKFEGVQEIKEDGTLIFTEEAVEVMERYFGMAQEELAFEEMADRAEEILAAYKRLAEKHNAPTYFF